MTAKIFLRARWENLVMVNYEVEPALLYPYLPHGVELDTYNDKTFVSLVGFRFIKTKLFGLPIPYFGSFNEVNLRFYVKRVTGGEIKRGVVFISEVVPYRVVSFLANKLYKEHYTFATMSHVCRMDNDKKELGYYWKQKNDSYFIQANFSNNAIDMEPGSMEEFIYEHYYGYTKVSDNETWEYKVDHPRWSINPLLQYDIQCDFGKLYGKDFSFLTNQKPTTVFNAIGSAVSIEWQVNKIKKG